MFEFIRKTLVITQLEVRKVIHDPTETFMRAVQPTLWLLIFGQVLEKMHPLQGNADYMDFMTPGILAQSVLFVAIFYGIAIIWERDLGLIHKLLTTPTPRVALVLGKALSASIRSLPILLIIYILAALLRVHISWNLLNIVGVVLMGMLGSVFFSTFSLIIACIVKTRERFMGIGQLMTMPLFFASNAIYPISMMPTWLQVISHINPLTYVINTLRALMIENAPATNLLRDYGVMLVASTVFAITAGALYKRVIY